MPGSSVCLCSGVRGVSSFGGDRFDGVSCFSGQPVLVVHAVKYDHEQPVVKESLEMSVAGGEAEPELSGEFPFGDAGMFPDDGNHPFFFFP